MTKKIQLLARVGMGIEVTEEELEALKANPKETMNKLMEKKNVELYDAYFPDLTRNEPLNNSLDRDNGEFEFAFRYDDE